MSMQKMIPDYGVASNARNRALSIIFFVPSDTFLVKNPFDNFSISTSHSPVMLRYKILMFVKQLSRIFMSKTSV